MNSGINPQFLSSAAPNWRLPSGPIRSEIDAVAVYGHYMTRHKAIAELELAITGRRRRPEHIKTFIGRATNPTEGTGEIRALFEKQSGFIDVRFFKKLEAVPRPFSVIFRAD